MPTYEWDADKAVLNEAKHGVPFEQVKGFDWAKARQREDTRYDYGETRFQAVGPIGGRLHVLIYALRDSNIRVISLRKANQRETRSL
ncbi:MAG: BrnT family toxin [Shimia sp.]